MLEQEVVAERDLRAKTDRTKNDIARDLQDALEQLRISRNDNETKEKELKVSLLLFNKNLETNRIQGQQTELNRLKQEIAESKAHHEVFIETLNQRQNLENEESAQKYDNLLKLKNRLELERDEAQHGMETMTRNVEMLTKTKVLLYYIHDSYYMTSQVHNERQIKKLLEEKKESDRRMGEMNDDLEKKDKALEEAENDMVEQKKLHSDLDYENQQNIRQLNSLQQNHDELNRAFELEQDARDAMAKQIKELKKDLDYVSDQHQGEINAKLEMQKALSKGNTELAEWRHKYEEEAVVKNQQLEEQNKALTNELNQVGDEFLGAKSKV